MVDCTGLENRRPFTGLVSSNLTLSANEKKAFFVASQSLADRAKMPLVTLAVTL